MPSHALRASSPSRMSPADRAPDPRPPRPPATGSRPADEHDGDHRGTTTAIATSGMDERTGDGSARRTTTVRTTCTTCPAERSHATARRRAADIAHVATVADAAVDVADDPAGQRDVEEHRPVVRRDRSGQRQVEAPRPRATIVHRHAQQTVVSTPRPAAAASARPSTARMPSRNGPTPRRQTRTANVPTATTRRAPISTADVPARHWQDQQVGVVHGDSELPGSRLRQTSACVRAGLGGQLDLLLARGTDPPGEPLRRQVGLGGAESPGARPDEDLGPQSTESLDGDRDGVRAEQAAASRSCGVGGRRMRPPRGRPADPPGSGRRDRRRTRLRRHGHPAPAQTSTSPASSSPRQQVEQRRGGDEGCVGEIARVQPGDVGLPASRR